MITQGTGAKDQTRCTAVPRQHCNLTRNQGSVLTLDITISNRGLNEGPALGTGPPAVLSAAANSAAAAAAASSASSAGLLITSTGYSRPSSTPGLHGLHYECFRCDHRLTRAQHHR